MIPIQSKFTIYTMIKSSLFNTELILAIKLFYSFKFNQGLNTNHFIHIRNLNKEKRRKNFYYFHSTKKGPTNEDGPQPTLTHSAPAP
jgi:hypothetical protein